MSGMLNTTFAGVSSASIQRMEYGCIGRTMVAHSRTHNGSLLGNQTTIKAEDTVFSRTDPAFSEQVWIFPAQEIPNLILYSVALLLAVGGNILVIITLLVNNRMRTVASCFLLSLSISDLMLAIICMPITLTGRILKRYIFGRVMCKVMPLLMGASVCISTFTMLAISVERYYAICRPLKSREWQTVDHAYRVIIGIWIFSYVLSLPYAIMSDTYTVPLIDYGWCTDVCRLVFPNQQAKRTWYLFLLLTLFCIPGILMTVAYTRVSCQIWREFQVKTIHTPSDSHACDDENDTSDGLYITHRRGSRKSLRKLRISVKNLVAKDSQGAEAVALNKTQSPKEKAKSTESNSSMKEHSKNSAENGRISLKKDRNNSRRVGARVYSRAETLKAKKKVVRMLIVIVVLFFVCWSPLFIVNVWKAFDPETAREKLDGIIEIIQLMSFASTCVNPLVYCFMNKRFRAGFLNAFLICVPGVERNKWGYTKRNAAL